MSHKLFNGARMNITEIFLHKMVVQSISSDPLSRYGQSAYHSSKQAEVTNANNNFQLYTH